MILKLKRSPGIYLVGFMGCGKSTVGKMLADEIGWRFVDLDDRIVEDQGLTINSIFEQFGEATFRGMETKAMEGLIREVHRGKATVAALGGGAFPWPGNREKLEDAGVSIWLDTPMERIEERIARHTHRPLARDTERFRNLFQERLAAYAQADYQVKVDSDEAAEVVQKILALGLFD
ncbi:MAG: shikimate kinase [Bryobacter sp.]|nr:shikimate kinase [Bryobacter sp.]